MTARHDPASRPDQHLRSPAIGVGKSLQPAAPLEQSVAWRLFFALLLVGAVILIFGSASSDDDALVTTEVEGRTEERAELGPDPATTPAETATSFTLVAGGDVLVHESVAASAATDDGFDFGPQLAVIAPTVRAADVAICHLEVPISATNDDLAYYPAFRVPSQLAPALAGAGFDSCSVASNHSLDAGEAGVASTLDQLDRAGVD
ncbi:MAG: hypothetical protein HKN26_15730, partial [Acidimicrobiales bacterium]|nr:hypothetical protein [Acidimicrobiales bacterium]